MLGASRKSQARQREEDYLEADRKPFSSRCAPRSRLKGCLPGQDACRQRRLVSPLRLAGRRRATQSFRARPTSCMPTPRARAQRRSRPRRRSCRRCRLRQLRISHCCTRAPAVHSTKQTVGCLGCVRSELTSVRLCRTCSARTQTRLPTEPTRHEQPANLRLTFVQACHCKVSLAASAECRMPCRLNSDLAASCRG